MIPVTKSFIPPIEEYTAQVKRAFDNGWLTNRGELVLELEEKLKAYLHLDNLLITNNGTIPLQIALKLVGKGGEIITTPFSYVATCSSIVWENCTPVFVDIDPIHWTIDPDKIEAAITNKTTAIVATHVFGNPCDVKAIDIIAKKHGISVIYDGAHTFGVEYKGKSIFEYGDVSTCSFHATKLFHTGEGGAIFCKDEELAQKIFYSHNFGHNGPLEFHGLGINAKISELQAAMGLCVLPHMTRILNDRKWIVDTYLQELSSNPIQFIQIRDGAKWNYSYFPIVFNSQEERQKVENALIERQVFPRRYFYPSLNTLPYANQNSMPISESISERILCLPLYFGLDSESISKISDTILSSL